MKLGTLICSAALCASMAVGVGVAVSAGVNARSADAITTDTTIYCKMEYGWWTSDSAAIGAYYWGGSNGPSWPGLRMSQVSGESNLWSITVPAGHSSIIFTRINPSGNVSYWDAKTKDQTIPTDGKNMFTITSSSAVWGDPGCDGTWGTYHPPVTVTRYAVVNGTKESSELGHATVSYNSTYQAPKGTYRSGYAFGGWFTNIACTSAYDSSVSLTADTDIYAKYTTSSTVTGTINIDLKNSGWAGAAANYAILFMDKTTYTTEQDAWSTYVTGTASGEHLVQIPYNIPFEPLTMTIVRYNAEYTQSDWNTQKWPTDGSKWGQTPDIDVNEMIRIGNTYTEGKNNAYGGYPKVIGGVSPAWADIVYLDSVKSNGSHNVEYYSTTVTLAANTEFKIQIAPYADGDYCGNYTTHASITSNFGEGSSGNIKAKVAGTYAFYFDGLANDGAGSVYITTVALAQADEWSQYFLGHSGCDASGKNLPSGWDDCAGKYKVLVGGAKDIIYAASADEHGSYVEQAVARYDHAVAGHPTLEKFIKNSSDVVRVAHSPAIVFGTTSDQTTMITVIAIASITSVSLIGGFFYIRKRKLG